MELENPDNVQLVGVFSGKLPAQLKCCRCGLQDNKFEIKKGKGGRHLFHKCPTCYICKMRFDAEGKECVSITSNHNYYRHKSCPRCDKCKGPNRKDDPVHYKYLGSDDDNLHDRCRNCKICGKGSVTEIPVRRWDVEEADDIAFAHETCLMGKWCETHKCYMPCTIEYH